MQPMIDQTAHNADKDTHTHTQSAALYAVLSHLEPFGAGMGLAHLLRPDDASR